MMLYVLAAAAATSPVLIAPSEQMKTEIARALDVKLLDGSSARYRWPKEDPDGVVYCGFVNAKNSYGAFTGFKPFYVMGAHADGPKGNGKYSVIKVELIDGNPLADFLIGRCGASGFDLSKIPE